MKSLLTFQILFFNNLPFPHLDVFHSPESPNPADVLCPIILNTFLTMTFTKSLRTNQSPQTKFTPYQLTLPPLLLTTTSQETQDQMNTFTTFLKTPSQETLDQLNTCTTFQQTPDHQNTCTTKWRTMFTMIRIEFMFYVQTLWWQLKYIK